MINFMLPDSSSSGSAPVNFGCRIMLMTSLESVGNKWNDCGERSREFSRITAGMMA